MIQTEFDFERIGDTFVVKDKIRDLPIVNLSIRWGSLKLLEKNNNMMVFILSTEKKKFSVVLHVGDCE